MSLLNNGVIADPRELSEMRFDFIAGGETGIAYIERLASGDWSEYEPKGEPQSIPGVFDTMACTHYASGHCVETGIIHLIETEKISEEALNFLKKNGYFTDVNDIKTLKVSKRFLAIMGENTREGNYFQKAWQTIRDFGLIPDKTLPFGGKTWSEYHDKTKVTPEMLALGKEFLTHFEIKYEKQYYFDGNDDFSMSEIEKSQKQLKQAPLNINIPGHSIMLSKIDEERLEVRVLDHYEPFVRFNDYDDPPIFTAYKGVVYPRITPSAEVRPKHTFNVNLVFGSRGVEVYWLQKCMAWEGLLVKSLINPDPTQAYFGVNTLRAVMDFQTRYKKEILVPAQAESATGKCLSYTRAKLNQVYG